MFQKCGLQDICVARRSQSDLGNVKRFDTIFEQEKTGGARQALVEQ
jgi:hypothetical protein